MAENKGIMNCSTKELHQIAYKFLTRFDDYIQLASDQGKKQLISEFEHAFHSVERVIHELEKGVEFTAEKRNELRCIIKQTEKIASVELLPDLKVFDLEFQWQFYLIKMTLNESTMPAIQKQETKRAFMGACGQMFSLLWEDLAKLSDEDAEEYFRKMINQVREYFQEEKDKLRFRNKIN